MFNSGLSVELQAIKVSRTIIIKKNKNNQTSQSIYKAAFAKWRIWTCVTRMLTKYCTNLSEKLNCKFRKCYEGTDFVYTEQKQLSGLPGEGGLKEKQTNMIIQFHTCWLSMWISYLMSAVNSEYDLQNHRDCIWCHHKVMWQDSKKHHSLYCIWVCTT